MHLWLPVPPGPQLGPRLPGGASLEAPTLTCSRSKSGRPPALRAPEHVVTRATSLSQSGAHAVGSPQTLARRPPQGARAGLGPAPRASRWCVSSAFQVPSPFSTTWTVTTPPSVTWATASWPPRKPGCCRPGWATLSTTCTPCRILTSPPEPPPHPRAGGRAPVGGRGGGSGGLGGVLSGCWPGTPRT